MIQPSQQPHKRKYTKNARLITTVCSIIGAIAALIAIIQFIFGIPNLPPFLPTHQPTPTTQPLPTPSPSPFASIHPIACSAASTDAGTLKFFTQGGNVLCFSGVGTIDSTIEPIVRVETGTTFATWQYVTISTGISHHSPQNSSYNCPGKVAHYDGGSMMRVTKVTIVPNSTSCS